MKLLTVALGVLYLETGNPFPGPNTDRRNIMKKAILSGFSLLILLGGVCYGDAQPVAQNTPDKSQPSAKNVEKSASTASSEKVVSTDEESLGPIGVFADIENGWRKEKEQQILQHYGKGKVTISIEGTGPAGGEFSKNQSHYLFKDLFKYTITTKFEFVQFRQGSDGQLKVYAVAERAYKKNDDGRLFEDKIYVSLQLENDRWVISEIKSVR